MQAIQLHAIDDIRIDTVSKPTPGDDDIVIKIAACGICASDHMFNNIGSLLGPNTPCH
jgi:D-arabinose 1-dehydrogenase-like Zn-dependent alcohol dehydrogenase